MRSSKSWAVALTALLLLFTASSQGLQDKQGPTPIASDLLLCSKCRGSGERPGHSGIGDKECPMCNGCGYFKFDRCKTCDSKGVVTIFKFRKDGEQEQGTDSCRICNGHGWLLRPAYSPLRESPPSPPR